jgi:hypothetical protein
LRHNGRKFIQTAVLLQIGNKNMYEFTLNQPTDKRDDLGLFGGPFSLACISANEQADAAWQMYLSEPSAENFAAAEAAQAYADWVCSPPPPPPPLIPPLPDPSPSCPINQPPWLPTPAQSQKECVYILSGGVLVYVCILIFAPVGG